MEVGESVEIKMKETFVCGGRVFRKGERLKVAYFSSKYFRLEGDIFEGEGNYLIPSHKAETPSP